MDSKKFISQWRALAVGAALTCLTAAVIGSAVDKNPVRTTLLAIAAFCVVNLVFLIATFLVDPPRKSR